jgi:hypothetical protein
MFAAIRRAADCGHTRRYQGKTNPRGKMYSKSARKTATAKQIQIAIFK